jgi:bacteriorhodopsin
MVFYGVLDLFAGPVFLFAFLAGLQDVEYENLGLQSGKASDYVGASSVRPSEKSGEASAA